MGVDTLTFDEHTIRQLSRQLHEPEWMLTRRLDAMQRFSQLPLPKLEKTRIDTWNFTSFTPYVVTEPVKSTHDLPAGLTDYLSIEQSAGCVVQRNNTTLWQRLDREWVERGVIFTNLSTAIKEHRALVKSYFNEQPADRLAALHTALAGQGIFLYVPRGVEITAPVEGIMAVSGQGGAIFPHIIIAAEAGSRVQFTACFVGLDGEAAVNNGRIMVHVGDGADVRVATINRLPASCTDVTYRRSEVGRDAYLKWVVADFSDGRVISDNTVNLAAPGGRVEVKTVTLGANEMRSNITTSIAHNDHHTTSHIEARAVVKDKASTIINSITKIEKGAYKADGQQSAKVLMLDREARGDANPILLIDENDVTAGHAASVGRIDPLQIYYMMSRGITKREAEKSIIFGFLEKLLAEIPAEPLRDRLQNMIEEKFDD